MVELGGKQSQFSKILAPKIKKHKLDVPPSPRVATNPIDHDHLEPSQEYVALYTKSARAVPPVDTQAAKWPPAMHSTTPSVSEDTTDASTHADEPPCDDLHPHADAARENSRADRGNASVEYGNASVYHESVAAAHGILVDETDRDGPSSSDFNPESGFTPGEDQSSVGPDALVRSGSDAGPTHALTMGEQEARVAAMIDHLLHRVCDAPDATAGAGLETMLSDAHAVSAAAHALLRHDHASRSEYVGSPDLSTGTEEHGDDAVLVEGDVGTQGDTEQARQLDHRGTSPSTGSAAGASDGHTSTDATMKSNADQCGTSQAHSDGAKNETYDVAAVDDAKPIGIRDGSTKVIAARSEKSSLMPTRSSARLRRSRGTGDTDDDSGSADFAYAHSDEHNDDAMHTATRASASPVEQSPADKTSDAGCDVDAPPLQAPAAGVELEQEALHALNDTSQRLTRMQLRRWVSTDPSPAQTHGVESLHGGKSELGTTSPKRSHVARKRSSATRASAVADGITLNDDTRGDAAQPHDGTPPDGVPLAVHAPPEAASTAAAEAGSDGVIAMKTDDGDDASAEGRQTLVAPVLRTRRALRAYERKVQELLSVDDVRALDLASDVPAEPVCVPEEMSSGARCFDSAATGEDVAATHAARHVLDSTDAASQDASDSTTAQEAGPNADTHASASPTASAHDDRSEDAGVAVNGASPAGTEHVGTASQQASLVVAHTTTSVPSGAVSRVNEQPGHHQQSIPNLPKELTPRPPNDLNAAPVRAAPQGVEMRKPTRRKGTKFGGGVLVSAAHTIVIVDPMEANHAAVTDPQGLGGVHSGIAFICGAPLCLHVVTCCKCHPLTTPPLTLPPLTLPTLTAPLDHAPIYITYAFWQMTVQSDFQQGYHRRSRLPAPATRVQQQCVTQRRQPRVRHRRGNAVPAVESAGPSRGRGSPACPRRRPPRLQFLFNSDSLTGTSRCAAALGLKCGVRISLATGTTRSSSTSNPVPRMCWCTLSGGARSTTSGCCSLRVVCWRAMKSNLV